MSITTTIALGQYYDELAHHLAWAMVGQQVPAIAAAAADQQARVEWLALLYPGGPGTAAPNAAGATIRAAARRIVNGLGRMSPRAILAAGVAAGAYSWLSDEGQAVLVQARAGSDLARQHFAGLPKAQQAAIIKQAMGATSGLSGVLWPLAVGAVALVGLAIWRRTS